MFTITTDVITLLDTLRNLLQRKAEINQEYFDNFIQPIWDAFTNVHQDYKISFRKYSDPSFLEHESTEALIQMIRADSIFSSDLRGELKKLIEYMPSKTWLHNAVTLQNFINTINEYFNSNLQAQPLSFINLRYSVLIHLERKGNSLSKFEVANYFLALAQQVQEKYENVADAYYHLKGELIS